MEEDEEKSPKIQLIAFTTSEKNPSPNELIEKYLEKNSHFIIKKNKQLVAFSSVLPQQKKPTKIMICTLLDLNMEYEGINEVNCYIIVIDLQKETSKQKFHEIISYIQKFCDLSKKIYLLGVKSDESEDNKVKLSEEELDQVVQTLNVEYEYFELNIDNTVEVSDKIIEILNYSLNNNFEINDKEDSHGRSCSIY